MTAKQARELANKPESKLRGALLEEDYKEAAKWRDVIQGLKSEN